MRSFGKKKGSKKLLNGFVEIQIKLVREDHEIFGRLFILFYRNFSDMKSKVIQRILKIVTKTHCLSFFSQLQSYRLKGSLRMPLHENIKRSSINFF